MKLSRIAQMAQFIILTLSRLAFRHVRKIFMVFRYLSKITEKDKLRDAVRSTTCSPKGISMKSAMLQKAFAALFLALILQFTGSGKLYPFDEISTRMKSLGPDLIGIVPDTYTDILRNPALLTSLNERWTVLSASPESPEYSGALFTNPTPFLSSKTRGGVRVMLAGSDTQQYIIRQGRTFMNSASAISFPSTSTPSDKLFISFYYSLPVGKSSSFGVNYLFGLNGLGNSRYSRQAASTIHILSSSESWIMHKSVSNTYRDNEEKLHSLRFGYSYRTSPEE